MYASAVSVFKVFISDSKTLKHDVICRQRSHFAKTTVTSTDISRCYMFLPPAS